MRRFGPAAFAALLLSLPPLFPQGGTAVVKWHPVPPSARVKNPPYPRDDGKFLSLTYRRILGRAPSPAEEKRLAGLLGRGEMLREKIVRDLFASDEFFLRQLFLGLLGREPLPEEIDVRLRHLRQGGIRKQVVENILESPEYRKRAGSGTR
jgi:hypothetical protein